MIPVIASPIKISAVPKPLVQPSKTSKQATNETLVGVTPCMPESGSSQQAKGRDASGSNAPSTSAVPAAGRSRDASGSNVPLNPPKSSKGAPDIASQVEFYFKYSPSLISKFLEPLDIVNSTSILSQV
ncbi:hypothetical protein AGABI2DRAFT_143732 [Agaricus bisporus var. bisporus H97]|uniref:hypothetical protein n=1 Tax=Agaricus bisporus var. bisporus (strain H97 / ATCC MYA-4626 / FGSC 10389) TaxID=936046 RepID=UPI00029F5ECA|nr:hypothetical protein AGABI2DRAFT_143732 [Agaricus bisporus var. bisporus H97]EKV46701.1 hypothetical protein AGABI2DRAFT_143732 [Agaricus bisporus var. bisporus H97]